MEQTYFDKTVPQALEQVKATADGLTAQEAARRLEEHGPNQLAEGKKKSPLVIFLEQFKDLLVFILAVAAVISMVSGNVESTLVIFAVLIMNAVLGTVQYLKAEKSLESLKAMSAPVAKVLRDGVRQEVAGPQVVPGDIVYLEAGDLVVADGRLLECYSLKVNESSLTGESEAVEKTADALPAGKTALGDQKNMVFSGSLVTYGRAVMLVTGTGMNTELGHIAELMNQTQQRKTPLQKSLDDFSGKLAAAILAICALVFCLSLFRSGIGLRQFCDIGLWAREYHAEIDWQRLYDQCASVHAATFAAAAFRIARDYLGIDFDLPTPWDGGIDVEPLLHDSLCGGVYGSNDLTRLHSSTVTLNAVKASRTGEKSSVLSTVFPNREYLERRYPYLKKRPYLLPVAWVQRIAHYASEKQSGTDNSASGSIKLGKERIELMKRYGIMD